MRKKYIPCPSYYLNFSVVNNIVPGFCTPLRKFPIDKIKFNKKYLAYANKIRTKDVEEIVKNFYIEAWEPVFLTPKFYLTDGQHRLTAARKMGLKYIDVVIIDEQAR